MHFLLVRCISWTGIIMISTVSSGAASTMQPLMENSFPSAPIIVARSTVNRSGKNTRNQKSKPYLSFSEVPPHSSSIMVNNTFKNRIDPLCLKEAMRRVILVITMIITKKRADTKSHYRKIPLYSIPVCLSHRSPVSKREYLSFFKETVSQSFFRAASLFLRLLGPGWQVR